MVKRTFLILFLLIINVSGCFAVEGNYLSEINVAPLQILYSTFDGDTTEFNDYNQTDLYDISGIVLEKSEYGKVLFLENLDIVSMADDDWIVDFDTNFQINSNAVYADDSKLIGINKSARIYFYDVDFIEPVIYHNGAICSSECSFVSYSSGIYIFDVSSLDGAYYIREKIPDTYCGDGVCNGGETYITCPADCDAPSSGGGGGGGGTTLPEEDEGSTNENYDFYVSPLVFDSEISKGSYFRKVIYVINNGSSPMSVNLYVSNLTSFIFPEVYSVYIEPGEIKPVNLDIYVSKTVPADLYTGKINFRSTYVRRSMGVLLNVKESDALFDLKINLLKKYIFPGGRVRANVTIINMGDLRNFDVDFLYKVIDYDKNNYSFKKEQFAINQTHKGEFFIDLPTDIPVGNYIFHGVVSYGNVNATAYDIFTVEKVSFLSWIILILIILVLMYLSYLWYKNRKNKMSLGEMNKSNDKSNGENLTNTILGEVNEVPDIS